MQHFVVQHTVFTGFTQHHITKVPALFAAAGFFGHFIHFTQVPGFGHLGATFVFAIDTAVIGRVVKGGCIRPFDDLRWHIGLVVFEAALAVVRDIAGCQQYRSGCSQYRPMELQIAVGVHSPLWWVSISYRSRKKYFIGLMMA